MEEKENVIPKYRIKEPYQHCSEEWWNMLVTGGAWLLDGDTIDDVIELLDDEGNTLKDDTTQSS